jgi:UV excision repair protein RAD23
MPLARSPEFVQLVATVQQKPELLPSIMKTLKEQQPEIAQLLNDNREDAYILFNSPLGRAGPQGSGGGGGSQQPGIQVTPEEGAAIDRLCAMGYDRNDVIQAFFACDKNEELAANLLSNGF